MGVPEPCDPCRIACKISRIFSVVGIRKAAGVVW